MKMRNCGLQCNGRFFSSFLPSSASFFVCLSRIHLSSSNYVTGAVFVSLLLPSPSQPQGGVRRATPPFRLLFPPRQMMPLPLETPTHLCQGGSSGGRGGEALILLHLSKRRRRSSYSANFVKGVAKLELVADASVARGMTMVGTTTNSSSSAATRTKT